MTDETVTRAAARYREGASLAIAAAEFGVHTRTLRYQLHRTTVIHHLDRAGVARKRVVRKMTDETVAMAAARYDQGASLAVVANEFGVHQRTLAREFRQAGASIRTRRGWTK